MKLKDIVPHCLKIKNGSYDQKYYWMIEGCNYQINKIERYYEDSYIQDYYKYTSIVEPYLNDVVHLSEFHNPNNNLTLNLDHEITIFDRFIIVHMTNNMLYDDMKVFRIQDLSIDKNTRCQTEYYVLGLFNSSGHTEKNLRIVFRDLIYPQPVVSSEPAELTLDEKIDNLIDELEKDARTMAIKKLKRMLNERL